MRFPAVLLAAIAAVVTAISPAAAAAPASHGSNPTGASTAATAGQRNVTFGAGPAAKVKVKGKHKREYGIDGRPYYTFDSSPGGQINDEIGIVNFAKKKQVLSIYTVDAATATDGDFTYSPQSAQPKDAGAWLAVGTPHSTGHITVAPRSRTFLPVHLRVPTNAQPGDHAAAVIVSLTGLVKGKSGQRVNLEQRVATRVIVRVSGTLHPELTVSNLHVSFHGTNNPIGKGSATVSYTVTNTGNALLGAAQQVDVKGLFGTTTHAAHLAGIPALLPGGAVPETVTLTGVFPELHMTAAVHLEPQGLIGDVNPGVHDTTTSTGFWAIPWILVAIVIVLVIAVVVEVGRRRRRHRAPGRRRAVASASPKPTFGEGATS